VAARIITSDLKVIANTGC